MNEESKLIDKDGIQNIISIVDRELKQDRTKFEHKDPPNQKKLKSGKTVKPQLKEKVNSESKEESKEMAYFDVE